MGPAWRRLEGGGWLHGVLDMWGMFTGDNIIYIYPDMITCLVGKFREGVMIEARESRVERVIKGEMLEVRCTTPDPTGPIYSYQPSDNLRLKVDFQQQDPYERDRVECRVSGLENAGEGVFAVTDIAEDTVACFYHGLYLLPGQASSDENSDYQIYLDWCAAPHSPALDIPAEAYTQYKASLGHKVNHSWQPNCIYTKFQHPVFGHTALAIRTIRRVGKGEELTAHYRYDPEACPDWYYNLGTVI